MCLWEEVGGIYAEEEGDIFSGEQPHFIELLKKLNKQTNNSYYKNIRPHLTLGSAVKLSCPLSSRIW